MEAQTALVRTDGTVELHAVAAVDAHFAAVVDPRHAEFDNPLRFHQQINHALFGINGIPFHHGDKGFQHLAHRLMEFRLVRVSFDHIGVNARKISILNTHIRNLRG